MEPKAKKKRTLEKPQPGSLADLMARAKRGDSDALWAVLGYKGLLRLTPDERGQLISAHMGSQAKKGPESLIKQMLLNTLEFDSYMLVRAQAAALKIIESDDEERRKWSNMPDPSPKAVEALSRVVRIEDRFIMVAKAYASLKNSLAAEKTKARETRIINMPGFEEQRQEANAG